MARAAEVTLKLPLPDPVTVAPMEVGGDVRRSPLDATPTPLVVTALKLPLGDVIFAVNPLMLVAEYASTAWSSNIFELAGNDG